MLVMRVLQGETIRSDIRDGNETGFERIVRNIFATFESSNGIDPHTCVKKRKSTDIITSLKFISQKWIKIEPFYPWERRQFHHKSHKYFVREGGIPSLKLKTIKVCTCMYGYAKF